MAICPSVRMFFFICLSPAMCTAAGDGGLSYQLMGPQSSLPPTKEEVYAIARDVCLSVC